MRSKSNLIDPSLLSVNVEFEPPPFVSYVAILGAGCLCFVKDDRRLIIAATVYQVTHF